MFRISFFRRPANTFSHLVLLTHALLLWACNPSERNSVDQEQDVIKLVNTFVGTGGHGHTYPGATAPFGMVQLSPDTRLEGWDGCSGYHYTDSVIYGFSHTHLSGTGVSDYGDVLFMPNTGEVQFDNGNGDPSKGYCSAFLKSTESASPGYYGVTLNRNNVRAELTATTRAGMHRYHFSEDAAHLIVDLSHRDQLTSHKLIQSAPDEISGHRISRNWAEEQHVYFVAQFSAPVARAEFNDSATVAAFHFGDTDTLLVRVGISSVSIENARKNLQAEIDHWDFDRVKDETEALWRSQLQKIEVKGGTGEEKRIFYSALYHTMLAPNTWSDVNGEYRGMDMEVHHAPHTVYTVFSLWDTFRALHPLFTIIERERTLDFLRTFLLHYEQGGRLPVWELAANETDCMIGYHSIPVIVDAYVKGITDFDAEKMLAAMVDVSRRSHFGLDSYIKNASILAGDEPESVSKTLEYAYDDWCIAQFAKALNHEEIVQEYSARAQYYRNLFDPETSFFRARMDGGWFSPFDPSEVNYNYTEANAWQYSMFAPQDISGLIDLHGGDEGFEKHLDSMFGASSETTGRQQADITGLIGQYAHGNEPSHHMAYLYNFTGSPHKTARRVRQIMDEMYSNAPDGLSGNEDCGQMSAWYVFSAMGFYPVTPGTPDYVIGSPVFDEVLIHLENGQTARLSREGKGPVVTKMLRHGEDYPQSFITHRDLMDGAHFQFVMGEDPAGEWGVDPAYRPSTSIGAAPIATVPFFKSSGATFTDSSRVELASINSGAQIFYRLNRGDVNVYSSPLVFFETTSVEAWAVLPDGTESHRIENTWHQIDGRRRIELLAEYANQYSAGGRNALIDHLRGKENYQTGRWQGYQAQDFEAVVDLGEVMRVKRISMGFLQDIKSWIWFPPEVRFYTSVDGEKFTETGVVANTFPDDVYGGYTQDYAVAPEKDARYIKITAPNYGHCPDWHLGAGGQSWLFADEIIIE